MANLQILKVLEGYILVQYRLYAVANTAFT